MHSPHLERRFGLLHATALNMSNMVGIGPFITIPLIIATMGGPQCMLGWLVGVFIAISDGMVWAELSSAMPGSGGTYVYLKRAYEKFRFGRAMPFLFVWQFILSGPLEVASGTIGISMYLSYFWKSMTPLQGKCAAALIALLATILLYRRISFVARATVTLWVGMILTVAWVILSGLFNFSASRAFDFPANAFRTDWSFFLGLGLAMRIAMYDYLGYYDVCYIGDEVKDPERVIPRAIVLSVIGVAFIYATMNLSIIGVIPWQKAVESKYIASDFMEQIYGTWAGRAVTVLIVWTAFASIFALLLGYSRIPYAAALDGYFFRVFGKLHPIGRFPSVSVLVLGSITVAASFLELSEVIGMLITARILIQFVGQIAAVVILRKTEPGFPALFRMWWYPIPCLVALVGWVYIFLMPLFVREESLFVPGSIVFTAAGFVVYLLWRNGEAIASGFRNYANFRTRTPRSEYWYWTLFVLVVSTVATIIDVVLFPQWQIGPIGGVTTLALFLPGLAVSVRRLHDIDRTGWWLLILLTGIGAILLITWYCLKGTPGPNRFGLDPLARA